MREAALQLFAHHGYEGTTVADICGEVGVGKGVFYWYFKSKSALFVELLQDLLDGLRRAQRAGRDDGVDPASRLEGALRGAVRFLVAQPAVASLRSAACHSRDFAEVVRRADRSLAADFAGVIGAGASDGSVRQVDPELTARAILAALFCLAEAAGEASSPAAVEDAAAALFLSGLRTRRAGPPVAVATIPTAAVRGAPATTGPGPRRSAARRRSRRDPVPPPS